MIGAKVLDRGFIVHAINPKQLDRLRDRFSDQFRETLAAMWGLSGISCAAERVN
jgi:hypothetical protein